MVESMMEAVVEVVEVVVDAPRSVTAAKGGPAANMAAGHWRCDHRARMHHGSTHGGKARSATGPTVTATAAVTTAAPTAMHGHGGRADAECHIGHQCNERFI